MNEENNQSAADAGHLPLVSLNHVSFVCMSVEESAKFYRQVLGFTLIKRPSSLDFKGAWLFSYGIGIHLLESDTPDHAPTRKSKINPKDNHISFQCSDMALLVAKLEAMNIDYVTNTIEDNGVKVDQLFFHDPDGYMIEICNCNNLPVLPLTTTSDALPAAAYSPLKEVDAKERNHASRLKPRPVLRKPTRYGAVQLIFILAWFVAIASSSRLEARLLQSPDPAPLWTGSIRGAKLQTQDDYSHTDPTESYFPPFPQVGRGTGGKKP